MLTGVVQAAKKGGVPSHGFEQSPFWGDLRQTGVDTWFKMYANGRYWEADQRYDDLWVVVIGKTGGFSGSRDPDITFGSHGRR